MRRVRLCLLLPLLSACAMGPDYERPLFQLPDHWPWESAAPQDTSGAPQADSVIPLDWWKQFDDPALTALEEEGLSANTDLLLAAARVAEARARLSNVDANRYPEIDLQANTSRTRGSGAASFGGFPASSKPYNNFGLAAVFNYEIDLWGRFARASESARAQLLATEANREAVRLAVAGEIAQGYFNLRALDAQIAITGNTITAREQSLRYQEAQYRHGVVDGLTFRQAESELANARATAPLLVQARQEQLSALGVLLGREPKALAENAVTRAEVQSDLPTPPAVPADLPSTLLERRADIKAAEQSLISANAEIGVAKTDYFPNISLSALLGVESSMRETLLQGAARHWQFGGNLVAPVLDFGRTAANVEATDARKDQAFAEYQTVVRNAFKEALDSMSAVQTSAERADALNTQTQARAEALRLAVLRYDAGYSPHLEVLDAERTLYQAQLDRTTAQRDRLIAAVNLYKALGGGWKTGETPPPAPSETPPVVAPETPAAPVTEEALPPTP